MPSRPPSSRTGALAYALRALGKDDLPATVRVGEVTYRHVRTVKHDFFAATGFYEDPSGQKAVLKMGRTTDFGGLPLVWLGAWLCRREMRFYTRLQDLPNIPRLLGSVGRTGFLHAYVEGAPLDKSRPVPDGFFAQLQALLAELHRRDIAYVDTNKPQNILQGADGRPYLIDFQISWDLQTIGRNPIGRWILRRLQREDLYHILKHKRRLRPDELTPQEQIDSQRRSWFIRLHRFVTRPYFLLRRRTFKRLRDSGQLLPEGSK
jgi:hypothetical protein